MSTDRIDNGTRFNCNEDGCHKNYESDELDFRAAWTEAKAAGWVTTKTRDDEWGHLCPKCKLEYGDD